MAELEKLAFQLGYTNETELITKFVLPVVGISFTLFVVILLVFQSLIFAITILLLGFGFVFLYPVIVFERKKVNINENLHLFITYAGTISTMKISRSVIFRRIAQKKVFGELSKVSNKVYYLAKQWNLGFSSTCKKIAKLMPSKVFADFLDRFAVVMDFGEDLDIFLVDEQDSLMEEYSTEYKQSLENIKMIQNVFVSLTISAAFLMSVALLLPLILGTAIDQVLIYSLLGVIGLDAMIFTLVKGFIPSDRIPHNLPIKNKGMKEIRTAMMIIFPISFFLLIILFIIDLFPFMVNFAIGLTPLLWVGFVAKREEEKILRREKMFPSFVRILGSAVQVRGGAMLSALFSVRVHDFGYINDMVIGIYRRLRLGSDKVKSWIHFAADTGSHLIFHFSRIFSESVHLGGNAEKIGEIVSNNFSKLLSLRKLRLQLTGSMRGSFYGTLVGFSAAIYMTVEIANMLSQIFTAPFEEARNSSLGDVVSSIAPTIPQIDLVTAGIYIGTMVLIHSLISSFLLKIMDGGFKSSALVDFPLMVWIGAAISIGVPMISNTMFPGLGLVS